MPSNDPLIVTCTVEVTFKVPFRVELGESIAICGDCIELGQWKLNQALQLTWTAGHVWIGQMRLPPGSYEYKVSSAKFWVCF